MVAEVIASHVLVTARLPCTCGECAASIAVAYNGLGLVTVSDPGWILRSVQRGERQVEIRAWRLECVLAERPATNRAVTRPVPKLSR